VNRPRATLMLATSQMPRHLELVFAALERSPFRDFEVIVCDDGSGPEARQISEAFASRSGIQTKHVWQEHRGFRKCRILNEGLRQSTGELLVFLDGDCVPHRDYVGDHVSQLEPGVFCAGRRVELGEKISAALTPEMVSRGFFDFPGPRMLWSFATGDSEHFQRTLRFPWPGVRRCLGMERIDDLKGCNYSVSRKDLEAINGFDEEYEGYGREDTDVELRLRNLGLRIRSMKGLALQFHVWHPRRAFTPANDKRLDEVKMTRRFWCEQGMRRN
jgi:cellulose synthase/poly-beta-1,6-N-acetylglucosamine synthase-like glycosyltransferase